MDIKYDDSEVRNSTISLVSEALDSNKYFDMVIKTAGMRILALEPMPLNQ